MQHIDYHAIYLGVDYIDVNSNTRIAFERWSPPLSRRSIPTSRHMPQSQHLFNTCNKPCAIEGWIIYHVLVQAIEFHPCPTLDLRWIRHWITVVLAKEDMVVFVLNELVVERSAIGETKNL